MELTHWPNKDTALVHLFAQPAWHDDARIIGTPAGLRLLRAAIDAALRDGNGCADAYTNDGEGFRVVIYSVSDRRTIQRLPVPYKDEIAVERRPRDVSGGVLPLEIFEPMG